MQKIGLVLVVLLGVLAALMLGGGEMLGYSGFGMPSSMLTGIGGMIAPIMLYVIIAFGVLAIFWLSHRRTPTVANSRSTTAPGSGSPSALEVSRMRYAKGEITKEQYDVIKHDLGK